MDDEMDDFGDLYADLDDHPSFPAFPNLSTGDDAKIDSKLAEIEPAVEELAPQLGCSVAAVEEVEETPMADDQSSSDSEDDLRIVLNEWDCLEFPSSRRVDLQSDEEDEGDDLVIVADQPSTDRRWAPDDDGLARVELGKGAESKRRSRYVGFNSVLYPRNAKASTSGGWEWDWVQMLRPEGTAFCNIAIPTAEQNGFGFSMPRNRTIFDVNIEAFERKPWQQQGVDLTDFFNFGLDEEGWRSYWQSLNHYRQQAAISIGLHNCEPSKLNQGEVSSSALENVEKRGRGFNMPKGRAIQVEDGEGERMPSIDIRRTRYRDSDVVIQITMGDSMDDASLSTKKERGHRNGFLHKSSNKIDCLLPLDCDQGFKDKGRPVESHHSEVSEIVSKVIEEGKGISKGSGELIPSRIDGPDIKVETTSGDHFLHHSNSSDSEKHSEASNNAITLEKDPNSVGDVSTISGIQLKESEKYDNYIPNNSRCDAIDRDEEDDPEFIDRPLRNHQSCRTRIRCLEVRNVPLDDKHIYSQDYRERRNESDHNEASCGTRDRGYKYDFDVCGRSPSYREMCKSVSYSSRRYAEKQASGHSNFRSSHRYDYQSKNLKGGSSESVSLLRQRDGVGDDEIEKREHYFDTRNNGVWAMRDSTSEDLNPGTSEHQLPSREKDMRCWHINKSEDCWRRMEAVYDEKLTENRCRERFLQGIHESHISYRSEEEEIFDYKFSRLVPYGSRELRNIEEGSFLDLDRPTGYAIKDSRNQKQHLNRKSLLSHTCRETNIACEGRRRVASPSKNDLPVSWRTSKTYVDHRELPNTEKIPSKKDKDVYFVTGIKDRHHLYNRNYLDVKDDERVARERVVHNESSASSERRKYNRLAKPRVHIDDEVSLSHHKKLSDMPHPKLCSSLERNSRHNSLVKHVVGGHKFFDNEYDIKLMEAEESAKFHLRARTSSVSDSFGNVVHELASVGCREAVTLHVNGCKGKLPRRCSKVTVDSNSHRMKECVRDDLLIGSRNIEDLCKRKEVSSCSIEMGVNHNSRSRLNKDTLEEAKSDHSNDHIMKNGHDTHPNARKHEDDEELEEGELLEEPDYEEVIPERERLNVEKKVTYRGIESSGSNNVEENHFQSEDFEHNDKIIEGYDKYIERYDNNHILQALAKMEKRKERFKEPIAPKDLKKSLNSQLSVAVVTDEAKQPRPSRKRRWGSS